MAIRVSVHAIMCGVCICGHVRARICAYVTVCMAEYTNISLLYNGSVQAPSFLFRPPFLSVGPCEYTIRVC